MLRLAFDFIITWRETRTRPNAYFIIVSSYIWWKSVPKVEMEALISDVSLIKEMR